MTQTNISDFAILSQIGKLAKWLIRVSIGTGAFSEVFKVFRKSDKQEYALKKVNQSDD